MNRRELFKLLIASGAAANMPITIEEVPPAQAGEVVVCKVDGTIEAEKIEALVQSLKAFERPYIIIPKDVDLSVVNVDELTFKDWLPSDVKRT